MRKLQFPILITAVTVPALLVLAQVTPVEKFERGFRPHVSSQSIAGLSLGALPQKRVFYLDGVEYAAFIRGDALDSSPDWDPSQPLPLAFAHLEQIARQELSKLLPNDSSWSVASFHLEAVPRAQSLKWFFQVEMKPFWTSGPQGTPTHFDSFCVFIDLSGKPGNVRRGGF